MHAYRNRWTGYRIYLSGPMTGLPGYNYPAFYAEAQRLRNLGYAVTNPAEANGSLAEAESLGWQGCIKTCLRDLTLCDSLVLMPGWQESQGAMLELQVAFKLGLQIRLCEEIQHGP